MVNSTIAPPEPKSTQRETRRRRAVIPLDSAVIAPEELGKTIRQRELFADALLDTSTTRPGSRALDFIVSLVVHTAVILTAILIPLYYTEAIDLQAFGRTMLIAPPPPPPPPPPPVPVAVVQARTPQRVMVVQGRLVAPVTIPQEVRILKEDALPPEAPAIGVVGGVLGGVPGGQAGGVIGGIISGAPGSQMPPLPPPTAVPKAPLRVGGRIKAPEPVFQPNPVYPPLARQARIEGEVLIDAVIDVHGNVVEMQVLSGHPVLIPAALEALGKWKYRPTYLNDEPVPVRLVVTLRFRLN